MWCGDRSTSVAVLAPQLGLQVTQFSGGVAARGSAKVQVFSFPVFMRMVHIRHVWVGVFLSCVTVCIGERAHRRIVRVVSVLVMRIRFRCGDARVPWLRGSAHLRWCSVTCSHTPTAISSPAINELKVRGSRKNTMAMTAAKERCHQKSAPVRAVPRCVAPGRRQPD